MGHLVEARPALHVSGVLDERLETEAEARAEAGVLPDETLSVQSDLKDGIRESALEKFFRLKNSASAPKLPEISELIPPSATRPDQSPWTSR